VTRTDAEAAFREGNALFSSGRLPEAIAAFRHCIELDDAIGAPHFNLAVALRRANDRRGALLEFRRAARLDALNFQAVSSVVALTAEAVAVPDAALFEPDEPQFATPSSTDAISVVVCSIDPAKLEAMQRNYSRAMAGREHEFVVIRDARSLAEGYNRGLSRCRFETVVFSHDDVEMLSADPFDRIVGALRSCDLVGLAGSRIVSGPAALWAGHPHLHGWIAYPAAEGQPGWDATLYSLEAGLIGGMQALDGVFFATRRDAALRIGFDEKTFDSFHFYDLDFTYRAHLAGLRVAVTTDVLAIHQSLGTFDERWQRSADRFRAKFPALRAEPGPHQAYAARLADRAAVQRFYREIRALARMP
jgi:hypothetical protein